MIGYFGCKHGDCSKIVNTSLTVLHYNFGEQVYFHKMLVIVSNCEDSDLGLLCLLKPGCKVIILD